MSNQDEPPPLPPLSSAPPYAYPSHGPQPPMPLGYVTAAAAGAQRPGIVQALGVTSICIGSLQGLLALFGLLSAVVMLMMGAWAPMTTTTTTTGMATTVTVVSPATTPSAMPTATSGSMPGATPPTVVMPTTQQAAQSAAIMQAVMNPGSTAVRATVMVLTAGSVVLSVWLLVAGIQTLRGRRSGRRLHGWWAPAKVIVETAGTVAAAIMTAQMMQAMTTAMMASMPPTPAGTPTMAFQSSAMSFAAYASAAIQWVFSLAYPIAVMIVLTRPSVRTYFETLDA